MFQNCPSCGSKIERPIVCPLNASVRKLIIHCTEVSCCFHIETNQEVLTEEEIEKYWNEAYFGA